MNLSTQDFWGPSVSWDTCQGGASGKSWGSPSFGFLLCEVPMIDLPPQGWLIVDKMTKLVQHFSQLGPNRPDHLSGCQEAQSQGPCPQTSLPHRKLLSTASTQPRPHRGQEYQDRASLLPREVAQFKGWRNPPGPETEAELHYPEFLELAKKEMSFMQGEAQLPTSCRGRERGEPGRGLAGGGRAVCGERG